MGGKGALGWQEGSKGKSRGQRGGQEGKGLDKGAKSDHGGFWGFMGCLGGI